nr:PDF receptor isoform X1 [Leptinotarsa decemlineata]
MMLHNNSTNNMTTGWCPEVCDKWKCWPSTQPGTNATMGCPKIEGTLENAKAYKYCDLTGSWETRNSTNGTYDYTHYENCILPQIQELAKMCDKFGETTCSQIGKITRCIEMVGLSFSFVSLVISLYIFFSYRVLKNNRTKIHKNLFIATLLQVIFRLIKYIDQGLDPTNKFIHKLYLNETCICLLEYTKTAMFMWMFIEGLYLHNMITVTVFQEYTYIKIYCYIGWIVPGLMTAAWLIFMLVKEAKTTWEYYYFLNYYWILEGPRSTVIVVNLLFLLNIIRVLIVKLRESQTSELEQVRKAVRAAIFLLPLMGISHILFFYYKFNEAWKFALWSFTSYFLGTFQGFFVAILYCFLNGEVQTAIKNSFYLHMSLRNYDYTPCRNFTLISITADDGNVQNGKASKWIRCCKQAPPSPEEKEISTSRSNWSSKHTVEETDTSLMEVKDTTE